jgi:hypothetical protein
MLLEVWLEVDLRLMGDASSHLYQEAWSPLPLDDEVPFVYQQTSTSLSFTLHFLSAQTKTQISNKPWARYISSFGSLVFRHRAGTSITSYKYHTSNHQIETPSANMAQPITTKDVTRIINGPTQDVS